MSPKEVAEQLHVSEIDLANWRRLPEGNPLRLPAEKAPDGRISYQKEEIVEWLVRNPKRLAASKFLREEAEALHHPAADWWQSIGQQA